MDQTAAHVPPHPSFVLADDNNVCEQAKAAQRATARLVAARIAAAEAAVGLAIIISIFRTRQTLNVDEIDLMKS